MSGEPSEALSQAQIDAAVRRYLARLGRRYSPLLVALALLLAVVVLIPSKVPGSGTALDVGDGGALGDSSVSGTSIDPLTGQAIPVDGSTPAGGDTAAVAGGGSTGAGTGGTAAGGARPAAPGAVGVGQGTSVTGVKCGAGVRQFAWSAYAPLCVNRFSGNNGGATGQGVTKDTITVTFRKSSSSQQGAASAFVSGANAGTEDQYVADMKTYINYFNTQFELYGRKVVMKEFTGQGDPLQENFGQNLEGAQADAVRAKDLPAFADLSLPLGSSTGPYADNLAQQKVLSFGQMYVGQEQSDRGAPYIYSAISPNAKQANDSFLAVMCKRMVGQKAVFSGDVLLQGATRKFGLILADRPGSRKSNQEFKDGLAACGGRFSKEAYYTLDLSKMPSESASIMAQMKADGVSTIMCGCDPAFLIFLTNAANGQQYSPEYLTVSWGDSFAQLANPDQFDQNISNGGKTPNLKQTEAYRAFKLAAPTGEPKEAYFSVPYLFLLQLFSGIQAAGPVLNGNTFAQGYWSLPGGRGDFGPWAFTKGKYTPAAAAQFGWYDKNATSDYNGSKGAMQVCNNGEFYFYDQLATSLQPVNTQMKCFNK